MKSPAYAGELWIKGGSGRPAIIAQPTPGRGERKNVLVVAIWRVISGQGVG